MVPGVSNYPCYQTCSRPLIQFTMTIVQGVQDSLSPWWSLKEAMYEPLQHPYVLHNDSFDSTSPSESALHPWTNNLRQIIVAAGILAIPFVFNYLFTLLLYHWTHNRRKTGQIPPQYPAMPFIGSTFSFLWDSASFVKKAT
jgi:hypothetical protein